MNALEQKIAAIIEPVIQDQGLQLVQLNMQGNTLQVMAENPETKNLGVDDCATLSREISALLDVEDPIKGKYQLEVSSPGIDRPLVRIEDYETYREFEAKIEVSPPIEGQKKFRGFLNGIENEDDQKFVVIKTDMGEYALPFRSIVKAKLVLTDNLLKKKAGVKRK